MKSIESTPQQRFQHFLLVVLLASLSGVAVFFVVTDKDIQVSTNDIRYSSNRDYFDYLVRAMKNRILNDFDSAFCEDPARYFHGLSIHRQASLRAIDKDEATQNWTRSEKEAVNRCLEAATNNKLSRACFLVEAQPEMEDESFIAANRALIEVQIQVRNYAQKRLLDCNSLMESVNEEVVVLNYFTVYWLPNKEDKPEQLQKRTDGFLLALPPQLRTLKVH